VAAWIVMVNTGKIVENTVVPCNSLERLVDHRDYYLVVAVHHMRKDHWVHLRMDYYLVVVVHRRDH